MKTFVMGDIHGAYRALLECLKLSKFDKKVDRLICLGDVCDRGTYVKECIDELLTIPNCILILGNHDAWSLEWMVYGKAPEVWLEQGGSETVKSFKKTHVLLPYIQFLTDARPYFVEHNRLFVHGGFDPQTPLEETSRDIFLWDRTLIKHAQEFQLVSPAYKFGNYDEVFVGHTPTMKFGSLEPVKFCNIWDLDTGAGHGAKLTMMDVDTKQFWQS